LTNRIFSFRLNRINKRELINAIYFWLGKFGFNLGLKDIKFFLHIPVNVVETLLRCVVVGLLSFYVSERRNHCAVKLFYFAREVVFRRGRAIVLVISRGTFRPDFPLNLLGRLLAVCTGFFRLNGILSSLLILFLCLDILNIFNFSSLNWNGDFIFFLFCILDDTVVIIISFVQNYILNLDLMRKIRKIVKAVVIWRWLRDFSGLVLLDILVNCLLSFCAWDTNLMLVLMWFKLPFLLCLSFHWKI
jgi:hypothetical protein